MASSRVITTMSVQREKEPWRRRTRLAGGTAGRCNVGRGGRRLEPARPQDSVRALGASGTSSPFWALPPLLEGALSLEPARHEI